MKETQQSPDIRVLSMTHCLYMVHQTLITKYLLFDFHVNCHPLLWSPQNHNPTSSFPFNWKKVKVKSLIRVRLFVTPWTVAHQAPPSMGFSRQEHWSGLPLAPLSMGFSRQEYWSGLPFPSPADLPDPGIKPRSPSQADALTSEPPGKLTFKVRVLAILTSYSDFLDLSLVYILLNFFDFLLLICLMSI